jgi:hypothetical protein
VLALLCAFLSSTTQCAKAAVRIGEDCNLPTSECTYFSPHFFAEKWRRWENSESGVEFFSSPRGSVPHADLWRLGEEGLPACGGTGTMFQFRVGCPISGVEVCHIALPNTDVYLPLEWTWQVMYKAGTVYVKVVFSSCVLHVIMYCVCESMGRFVCVLHAHNV